MRGWRLALVGAGLELERGRCAFVWLSVAFGVWGILVCRIIASICVFFASTRGD